MCPTGNQKKTKLKVNCPSRRFSIEKKKFFFPVFVKHKREILSRELEKNKIQL